MIAQVGACLFAIIFLLSGCILSKQSVENRKNLTQIKTKVLRQQKKSAMIDRRTGCLEKKYQVQIGVQ